ncbi:Nucleoid-associated protein YgaU, contains BON and LysM domains [Friedmanniella luteola]|uniref:Nucleoid-associated protein YgaU, contains BON and LysM domains n=1 Tax=Friedmanniella luteola TaxID=546871 RepID=A0A1H2A7K1_9ACTN|nr:LysM peptidoglycan-binding domain-containing protein [Friedmanniella luteola]SDT41456.1 Nucleoid-associated protein YgaU, contains BON and LysM domains [Friedmanniella luteola]
MTRWLRGVGALLLLLALLGGVPLLLLAVGARWPTTWSPRVLLQPDDGTVLLALITAAAWSAWAVLVVSVLAELLTVATRARVRIRLPGLAGPQRLVAGLVVAVLALAAAPAVPHVGLPPPAAEAQPRPAPAPPAVGPRAAGPTATRAADPPVDPSTVVHEVQRGDDLWTLAERYYGQGRDWRRIAAANPDRLTGGPDRLEVGWRLQVPGALPVVTAAAGTPETVTVRAGDTLSALAEQELGDDRRWPELFDANRAVLDDPDELDVGTRLVLPLEGGPGVTRPEPEPEEPAVAPAHPRPLPPAADGAPPAAPTTRPAPAPPTPEAPTAETPTPETPTPETAVEAALPLAAVGGLLAAGLLAGLAARRRRQLAARPVGRRIVHPDPATVPLEAALGRTQRPLTLRTLDQALRAVAAGCRDRRLPLPALQLVLLAPDRIELRLAAPAPHAPVGFEVAGAADVWVLDRPGADHLAAVPASDELLRPWPTLVTLGRDAENRTVLADLESLRLLQLVDQPAAARAVLAALAVELSFSPWAEEMRLTLLGRDARLPDALGAHTVEQTVDVDGLLDRLERRAAVQRRHQPQAVLGQHRLDPDLAEPWAPEVVLVDHPLTAAQTDRLRSLVGDQPHVTTAVVVVGDVDAPWRLGAGDRAGGAATTSRLEPAGLDLVPQALSGAETDGVLELVAATGRTSTGPAPWWNVEVAEPEPPPDNVTYLGRRFGGWSAETRGEGDEVAAIRTATALAADARVDHPTLLVLGPVELLGATGTPPPRAARQCLEYCGWLLEHPGRTARDMASALAVAEGTRRSNVSRLRSWLGADAAGEPYLPDAYTGRIALHPAVSSDWQQVQILTAGGVDRAGDEALRAVLQLLRGAPLADAAPGQWHWAEELRTDLISCVRDVGVELAGRALEAGDVGLARWAAARALAAAPGDELLLAARIRTEHRAGNGAETERLTLQLAGQARRLGVDLDPATVTLLQEVVEGQVRARMA